MTHSPPDTPNDQNSVTPLELFFDLVFVFAVSQLSHHLLEHLTWRGVAETLVLFLAVFSVWVYTSWVAVMIPADQSGPSGTFWMILGVMLLGFFMNAALANAFALSPWAFVVPFLLIQFGRTIWTVVNAPNGVFRDHFVRTLIWLFVTAPLWIVGAAVDPEARLGWWALAAGIDILGAWRAHPVPGRRLESEDLAFPGGLMLERCRLFLIIALGETVLTTGVAVAAVPMSMKTVVLGTVALVGIVALWALSFGHAARIAELFIEETNNPVYAVRQAANGLSAMVVGLIAMAVVNEEIILHPSEPLPTILRVLLFGGPVLFLLAEGWYIWAALRTLSRLRLVGSAWLVLLGVISGAAPPAVTLGLVTLTLVILAIVEQRESIRTAMAMEGRPVHAPGTEAL